MLVTMGDHRPYPSFVKPKNPVTPKNLVQGKKGSAHGKERPSGKNVGGMLMVHGLDQTRQKREAKSYTCETSVGSQKNQLKREGEKKTCLCSRSLQGPGKRRLTGSNRSFRGFLGILSLEIRKNERGKKRPRG